MRFLADENFPGSAVEEIRRLGHDILWTRKVSPGAADIQVLEQAASENRILLTFDKDFGELIFRLSRPVPPGVILFRLPPGPPAVFLEHLIRTLRRREDWGGHFSVVEADKIRMIPITNL